MTDRMIAIPAVTVFQPWAQAIALGLKTYETRPRWYFRHRGLIAIHAGKMTNYTDERRTIDRAAAAHARDGGSIFDVLALGEFAPGRVGLKLRNIVPLARPIPARGKQGLWPWRADPEHLPAGVGR